MEDGVVTVTSSSTNDNTTSNKGDIQKVGFLKSLAKKFMQDIENKKSKSHKRNNKMSRCCPSKNNGEGCPCELGAVTTKSNKNIDGVDRESDDNTNDYHNGGSFLYHQSDKPPTDFGQGANSNVRFDQQGVITNYHNKSQIPKKETYENTGGID